MQTTCPECGTAFRVAPAQLAHRRGWVRCGRCSAPFDALAALTDEPPGLRVESLGRPSAGLPASPVPESAEPPRVHSRDAPVPSVPSSPRKRHLAPLIWGLGGLLALLLLSTQWALLLRLPLVAWWPESEPAVRGICSTVACPPLQNRWAEAVPSPYRIAHLDVRHPPTNAYARSLHIRVRNEAAWTLPEPGFIVTLQTRSGRHDVFIPPTGGASQFTELAPAEQRYRRLTVSHPDAREFTVSVRPVPALRELTGLQQDPIWLP